MGFDMQKRIQKVNANTMYAGRQFRHELKFYISYYSYYILQPRLAALLTADPNGDEFGEYHIRSLYFDDIDESALVEKIAGDDKRSKIRIRIYDKSDRVIKLERKMKAGQYISKDSCSITREEAEELIAGDPSSLLNSRERPRGYVFRAMRERRLRPVRIVDYVREAYTYPIEDVRITFDKDLHAGYENFDLFDPDALSIPKFDPGILVMEVKYNNYLVGHIRDALQLDAADRQAISKYTICRQFDY